MSPVVVFDEALFLSGRAGRCRGVPFVIGDMRVGFDEHVELQIFTLIHLNRKTSVG